MNDENFGLTKAQMAKLKREIELAKSLDDDDIVPASEGEVEAIEIAFELARQNDIMVKALREIVKGMREISSDGSDYADGVLSAAMYDGEIAERALENAGIPLEADGNSEES